MGWETTHLPWRTVSHRPSIVPVFLWDVSGGGKVVTTDSKNCRSVRRSSDARGRVAMSRRDA
jgi:hypothetical protein